MGKYIVPENVPLYCNHCPFGWCKYQHPWADKIHNGDKNLMHGYGCNLLKRMTSEGPYGSDLPKPADCPLKELHEQEVNL